MEQVFYFWNKYKLFILSGLLGVMLILLVILMFKNRTTVNTPGQNPQISSYPSPTLFSQQQKPFQIIKTSPSNGQTNVDTGEIEISFTTDNPILTAGSFSLDITPPLPYYSKIINTYPTNTVSAKVFGGLKPNTTYTVTVKNSSGSVVSSWSFTTSSQEGSSSSALQKDEEEKWIKQYEPLFGLVPYSTTDFTVDYTDKLTLKVTIKNSNVEKVKQEVLTWIKSKGVDPTTHTINYVNGF